MEFIIIGLLMLLNGLFAMAEIALVSSRKIRLKKLAKHGNKRAAIALALSEDPEKFLPTVQIGMTAVSVFAGAYSGSTIGADLSDWIAQFSFLKDYANILGYFIVVSITTFFTLVVGELVPKTIGLNRPEEVAILLAPLMKGVALVASPLIYILNFWTAIILKVLKVKKKKESPVTEEELIHLIEQGEEHGVLEKSETQMVKSVFRMSDNRVDSFMTHKSDLVWIDESEDKEEILKKISDSSHSYFPVCNGSTDDVIGLVSVKDIFIQLHESNSIDLKNIIRDPLFVPETMPAIELLETFRKTRNHTGLIVNEFGSLEGIVTLYDIMEALVGELPDEEGSDAETEVVTRKDGSMLIDGMMQINEWSELLQLTDLTEKETGIYKTLGGFVMHQVGKIPRAGDLFHFGNYVFEVMDMDGMRVDKVLVKKKETPESTL